MRVSGGRTGCRIGKWEFLLESSRAPQRTQKYVRSSYGGMSELTTLSWGSDFCSYVGWYLLHSGINLSFIVTVIFGWRNKTTTTLIITSNFEDSWSNDTEIYYYKHTLDVVFTENVFGFKPPENIFLLDAIKNSFPSLCNEAMYEVQNILITLILNSGTRWRWSGLLPLHRKLGDCHSRSARFRKENILFPLLRIEPRTINSTAPF
jgi:hypothetical protein